jgi:subtilisin family serine protease
MVKGKKHLCSTFQIRKYFKAFQGIFEIDSNWYSRLEKSVVENHIDDRYQDFLAQPVVEADTIKWFAKFNETAIRLTELEGDEREKYEQLKDKTLAHYKSAVRSLEQQGKSNEAEYLQKAIKYIDDRFVYCFDDKVVLGVWGMQLRDNLKEPFGSGEIAKSIFVPQKANPEPIPQLEPDPGQESEKEDEAAAEPEPPVQPEEPSSYTVRFNSAQNGRIDGGDKEFQKNQGETISENEIPNVNAESGYDSNGWDENPKDYIVDGDKNFTAQYKRWPWYKRLWYWFKNTGWKWLLALLLILLLICLLFRGCTNQEHVRPLPADVHNKPWVETDPRSGEGGIYNPGDPYGERPETPPEYQEVLPPSEGILSPIDSTQIVQEPDKPTIIGNRLNILMGNEDRDIKDLAKAFKEKYPDDKYKVVYYDNVVKRMQIELPSDEREKLKDEIPGKLPEYELFVFDESLFSGNYTPNDPDFNDDDKAWYLNAIDAPKAWEINRGSESVTIAIVDNGFSLNHPELKAKVVMPYNVWLHSSNVFPQKVDHGTHVAGTALAFMDNGIGLCGIAPNVAFMPVQVADENGVTTTTSVLDGILYALYQGADVINLSMGMEFPGTFPPEVQEELKHQFKPEERLWREVMRIANKHNAVIVIAAGNNNMLAEVDPINRPENFIVVSAVDKNQAQLEKAIFSDYGRLSTISAPGVDIHSTVGNQGYEVMSGTSMAAPIIAGSVALMKSLNDTLTVQQIVCAMQSTGKPTAGDVGNFLQLDQALKKVVAGDFQNCEPEPPSPSSGDVQVLLSWDNYNDLDLICVDPAGDAIWFENKRVSSRGQLEIDMNVEPQSNHPIENIYWPTGKAPNGTYNVYVLYYKNHQNKAPLETPFKVKIKYGEETENFSGTINQVDKRMHVATFTLGSENDTQVPGNPSSEDQRVSQLEDQKKQLQKKLQRIDNELEQLRNLNKSKD